MWDFRLWLFSTSRADRHMINQSPILMDHGKNWPSPKAIDRNRVVPMLFPLMQVIGAAEGAAAFIYKVGRSRFENQA